MKLLVDLNVVLDVVQRREPHYAASAAVLGMVADQEVEAAMAAHGVTTLYYLVSSSAGREEADQVVDWLLARFEILPESRETFLRARNLPLGDFEDAVVASAAEEAGAELIVTRNVTDFAGSPVRAVTPDELLGGV